MEAEEMHQRFAAAAHDLGLALSGLQALRAAAPADVAEDVAAVQRQLGVLRFSSSGQQEQLASQLLQAVVLLHMRQCEGGAAVAPLLLEGMALAGLSPRSQAWLDFEVGRLRDAARAAARQGDPITEFFYKQVGVRGVWAGCCGVARRQDTLNLDQMLYVLLYLLCLSAGPLLYCCADDYVPPGPHLRRLGPAAAGAAGAGSVRGSSSILSSGGFAARVLQQQQRGGGGHAARRLLHSHQVRQRQQQSARR